MPNRSPTRRQRAFAAWPMPLCTSILHHGRSYFFSFQERTNMWHSLRRHWCERNGWRWLKGLAQVTLARLGFGTTKAGIASEATGTRIHAVDSLAGADGWSVAHVPALLICLHQY